MSTTPLLYLPLLHKGMGFFDNKALPKAQNFWTGLSQQKIDYTWHPDNLPLLPKETDACLRDIQNMGEIALSGVPIQALINTQSIKKEAQDINEIEAIESFINTENQSSIKNTETIHELYAAQKLLLWAWLMEEHAIQLQKVTKDFKENISKLTSPLGIEEDSILADINTTQNILGDEEVTLPNWKLVLENIVLFLPNLCAIIVNHKDMIKYIEEYIPTVPLNSKTKSLYSIAEECQGLECTLTIDDLLKKNALNKGKAPWLAKTLHCIIIKEC